MSKSSFLININQSQSVKKRKIEDKLSDFTDLVHQGSPLFDNNICFNVQSSTEASKMYEVSIINDHNGIKFECNCGDQWSVVPKRDHCKHIGGVISNLIKIYVRSHFNKIDKIDKIDKTEVMDDNLENIIEKFKKLL